MATLKFYLDCRRPKADGTCVLKLSITHERKVKYISLPISLHPALEWNGTDGLKHVTSTNRGLDFQIKKYMMEAQIALDEAVESLGEDALLGEMCEYVAKRILPERRSKARCGCMFLRMVEEVKRGKSDGTKGLYDQTTARVRDYCRSNDGDVEVLTLEEIDQTWLQNFDDFMAASARRNSRNIHLRNIRAVFNHALDYELVKHYPFRRFKIKPEATRKRSLPVEDLRELLEYPVEDYAREYIDMFKLIFMLIGINAVDLFTAQRASLCAGRLEYSRAKTHRLYSVKVEPEAAELIERYSGEGYLLSVCDRYGSYKDYLKHLNTALQNVGPMERRGRGGRKERRPLFPGLTTYWARHSWATIAASLDIPKETIAAALGHGGNSVTDIYIDFDQRKVDEANRRVIDWVLYGRR